MEHPIIQAIKSRIAVVKTPLEINFMDLSDIQCSKLPNQAKSLLETCSNLYHLNLSNCGLQSLSNMPHNNIEILLLRENKLFDNQIHQLFIYSQSLRQLGLQKNEIRQVESLKIFNQFTNLGEIDLKKNPLCQAYPAYAQMIFQQILPSNNNLTIIDSYCRSGEIISDEENNDQNLNGPQFLLQNNTNSQNGSSQRVEQQMIVQQNSANNNINIEKPIFTFSYNMEQQLLDQMMNDYQDDYPTNARDNLIYMGQHQQFGQNKECEQERKGELFSFKASKKRKMDEQQDEIDY